MQDIQQKQFGGKISFVHLMAFWVVFVACYVILSKFSKTAAYAGYLALINEVGLDLVVVLLSFYLWKMIVGKERRIFAFFGLSFFLAAATDIGYNVIANILGVTQFTFAVDSIFDIPFLGALIFQLISWSLIFLKTQFIKNKSPILVFCLIAIITLIIFGVFVFGIPWESGTFSGVGFYIALDTFLQIFTFILLCLCMASAHDHHIRLISMGCLVITVSDYVVHYYILINGLAQNSILETMWVLGLLFIMFGLYGILKNLPNLSSEVVL